MRFLLFSLYLIGQLSIPALASSYSNDEQAGHHFQGAKYSTSALRLEIKRLKEAKTNWSQNRLLKMAKLIKDETLSCEALRAMASYQNDTSTKDLEGHTDSLFSQSSYSSSKIICALSLLIQYNQDPSPYYSRLHDKLAINYGGDTNRKAALKIFAALSPTEFWKSYNNLFKDDRLPIYLYSILFDLAVNLDQEKILSQLKEALQSNKRAQDFQLTAIKVIASQDYKNSKKIIHSILNDKEKDTSLRKAAFIAILSQDAQSIADKIPSLLKELELETNSATVNAIARSSFEGKTLFVKEWFLKTQFDGGRYESLMTRNGFLENLSQDLESLKTLSALYIDKDYLAKVFCMTMKFKFDDKKEYLKEMLRKMGSYNDIEWTKSFDEIIPQAISDGDYELISIIVKHENTPDSAVFLASEYLATREFENKTELYIDIFKKFKSTQHRTEFTYHLLADPIVNFAILFSLETNKEINLSSGNEYLIRKVLNIISDYHIKNEGKPHDEKLLFEEFLYFDEISKKQNLESSNHDYLVRAYVLGPHFKPEVVKHLFQKGKLTSRVKYEFAMALRHHPDQELRHLMMANLLHLHLNSYLDIYRNEIRNTIREWARNLSPQEEIEFFSAHDFANVENRSTIKIYSLLNDSPLVTRFLLAKELLFERFETSCDTEQRHNGKITSQEYLNCFKSISVGISQKSSPFPGYIDRDDIVNFDYHDANFRLSSLVQLIENDQENPLIKLLSSYYTQTQFTHLRRLAVIGLMAFKDDNLINGEKVELLQSEEIQTSLLKQLNIEKDPTLLQVIAEALIQNGSPQELALWALNNLENKDFDFRKMATIVLDSKEAWKSETFVKKILNYNDLKEKLFSNVIKESSSLEKSFLKYLFKQINQLVSHSFKPFEDNRSDAYIPYLLSKEELVSVFSIRKALLEKGEDLSAYGANYLSGVILRSILTSSLDISDSDLSSSYKTAGLEAKNLFQTLFQVLKPGFFSPDQKEDEKLFESFRENIFFTMMDILQEMDDVKWPEGDNIFSSDFNVIKKYKKWLEGIENLNEKELAQTIELSDLGEISTTDYLSTLRFDDRKEAREEIRKLQIFKLKRLAVLAELIEIVRSLPSDFNPTNLPKIRLQLPW